MKWRRWNHILHRDIGYFCIGLTVIYAVSGIAVNHLSHTFNPSYNIEKTQTEVTPLAPGEKPDQRFINGVLKELEIPEPFKNGAMLSPGQLRIFTKTHTVDVELISGKTQVEKINKIPVLYEFNFLHLNKAKGAWTWIADIYGIALCFLAVSGLLMIKGRTVTRGVLFTLAGILLPAMYLVVSLWP